MSEKLGSTRTRPALARTAAILCSDPDFRRFLSERFPVDWRDFGDLEDKDRAAAVLRSACRIESRKELDLDPGARRRFDHVIRLPYSTWRSERVP